MQPIVPRAASDPRDGQDSCDSLLVAAYSIATTSDAINTLGFVAFILWAIWLIATSVVMYRATYNETTPAPVTP
jgi:hypothetical protein